MTSSESKENGKQRRSVIVLATAFARLLMTLSAELDIADLGMQRESCAGFVMIANHRSLLDLVAGLVVFRRWRLTPFIFVQENYFAIPLFGSLLRAIGGVPAGPSQGLAALRRGVGLLQQGHVLVVMPEGKIQGPDLARGQVGKLMPGVARLASEVRMPVLVVGIMNTDLAWPLGRRFPKLHIRRSKRPRVVVAVDWLCLTEGMSNTSILSAMKQSLCSVLHRIDETVL